MKIQIERQTRYTHEWRPVQKKNGKGFTTQKVETNTVSSHVYYITGFDRFGRITVYIDAIEKTATFYSDSNVGLGNLADFLTTQRIAIRILTHWQKVFDGARS